MRVPAHLVQLALDQSLLVTVAPGSPCGAPFPTLEVSLLLQFVESKSLGFCASSASLGFLEKVEQQLI